MLRSYTRLVLYLSVHRHTLFYFPSLRKRICKPFKLRLLKHSELCPPLQHANRTLQQSIQLRVHISLTPCTAKFNNGISWLSGNPGTSGSDNSALYQRALYWRRALVTWSGLVPGSANRSARVALIYRQNNLNKLSCWCSRNVYGD